MSADDKVDPTEETRPSNPNSTGKHGLEGGMGVSSERTGPEAPTDHPGPTSPVEGLGTVGTSRDSTDGTTDESAAEMAAHTSDDPAETPYAHEDENPAEVPSHPLGHKNPGHAGQ